MSQYGLTALIAAVRTGSIEVVRMLLDAGADVNSASVVRLWPRLVTSTTERLGNSPYFFMQHGATPIIVASDLGHAAILRLLLAHPLANVNAQDEVS